MFSVWKTFFSLGKIVSEILQSHSCLRKEGWLLSMSVQAAMTKYHHQGIN